MILPLEVYIFGDTSYPAIDNIIQEVYNERYKDSNLNVRRVRKGSTREQIKNDIDWAYMVEIVGDISKPIVREMIEYMELTNKEWRLG